jgi:diguanylate cyclase (GGDEF)-like protein
MENTTNHNFEEFREMIDAFSPCMDDYPFVFDLVEDVYYISEGAKERFCVPDSYFTNATKAFEEFVHPEDLDMLSKDIESMMRKEKTSHNITYRWLGKKREPIWINCRGRVLYDEEGTLHYLIGCVNEVGRKPLADNVSGLLESSAILGFINDFCVNSKAGFILRVGIDDFKDINERVGLEYGDFVLHGVASCVDKALKPGQKAFRVPADEYLIIDFSDGTRKDAEELYRKIRFAVDQFIAENGYEAVFTISGGILDFPAVEKPVYKDMMMHSQFALSEAKKRGKNQVYTFDEQDYQLFLRKKEILKMLRKSVEEDCKGFELFFQPIVHADTGILYAAEALLRFQMPDGERISPGEFIPVLEDSGLIIPVGKWVIREAVSMCTETRKYLPEFKVSVNLSYVQILKSPIADDICRQVEELGLPPESLIVEMTESGFLEYTPPVRRVWNHLKEFGVSIAIDDFGTGYSNLQSIGNLTPNVVKIDRGFTVKALSNDYEKRVLRNIVDMVHSIHLKLCVEGIETEEELAQIRQIGPDYIQGFYFGKPCNREDFLNQFARK